MHRARVSTRSPSSPLCIPGGQVDPSAPNILNPAFIGDNVLARLHRPFWVELQSRYGNMFYVREQVRSFEGAGSVVRMCQYTCLCLCQYTCLG